MSFFPRLFLVLSAVAALCVSMAAQDQETRTADDKPVDQQVSPDPDPDLVTLLPSMSQRLQKRFVYGATIMEGYGSSNENSTLTDEKGTTVSSAWYRETFTAVRPYVGLDLYRGRMRLNLQSAPILTYTPSQSESFGINGFLDPRLGLAVQLSPKLWLNIHASASYGDQFSQVLALGPQNCEPQCTTSDASARAGENPVLSSEEASSASHTFTSALFSTSGQIALAWRRSVSQEWSFSVGESYSTVPWDATSRDLSSSVSVARIQMSQHITPLANLFTYTDVHRINSSQFGCTLSGGGIGYQQQWGRFTAWSIEGGPEYGDRGCNRRLSGSFSGTFRRQVARRTTVTLGVTRGLDTYYVPGSVWVTSIGAGLHRRTTDKTSFELTGGYLDGSNTGLPQSGYSSYFVTPRFLWEFTNNLSLQAGYGHLSSSEGSPSSFAHDWATVGLSWHPRPKSF